MTPSQPSSPLKPPNHRMFRRVNGQQKRRSRTGSRTHRPMPCGNTRLSASMAGGKMRLGSASSISSKRKTSHGPSSRTRQVKAPTVRPMRPKSVKRTPSPHCTPRKRPAYSSQRLRVDCCQTKSHAMRPSSWIAKSIMRHAWPVARSTISADASPCQRKEMCSFSVCRTMSRSAIGWLPCQVESGSAYAGAAGGARGGPRRRQTMAHGGQEPVLSVCHKVRGNKILRDAWPGRRCSPLSRMPRRAGAGYRPGTCRRAAARRPRPSAWAWRA